MDAVKPASLALVAALLSLGSATGGCVYDPHAALAGVDLHVVVLRLDARATLVEVSARSETPTDSAALARTLAPDPDGRAEVFVPRLPEGRFVLEARARDANGATLACATLDRLLDAAAAPHDVTLDMQADDTPCGESAPPESDAGDDARTPPGQSGRPDAGPTDDDDRRLPPDRDMRLRKDAENDDEDEQR
jgi:hypothetical protein